jgi:hypothetical protein
MTQHVHEPDPGSVWDAAGEWRPTAEQHLGKAPFRGTCRTCHQRITRGQDTEWELAPASVVPAREYEPGYNAEREWQDWANEMRRNRREVAVEAAGLRFDVDLSPASPGPAWEWPVNDLGGQDPAPKHGKDENDLDEEAGDDG